ncbi:MAG: hypothetical protein AAF532_16455 [Planctomycetota bacterium]
MPKLAEAFSDAARWDDEEAVLADIRRQISETMRFSVRDGGSAPYGDYEVPLPDEVEPESDRVLVRLPTLAAAPEFVRVSFPCVGSEARFRAVRRGVGNITKTVTYEFQDFC